MAKNNSLLNIIYEDGGMLVLNKPAGLVVDSSSTSGPDTLQSRLSLAYEDLPERSGIVHRLDRDTSGIIVVAKSDSALKYLQKQFKLRRVHKEYLALVCGEVSDSIFKIDAPIGRSTKNKMRFGVVSEGKPASTECERLSFVESGGRKYTLIKVFPHSGRTHQIRVHLAAMGHPVAGDVLYSSDKLFGRLMLHALSIKLIHPKTKKEMQFTCPPDADFVEQTGYSVPSVTR